MKIFRFFILALFVLFSTDVFAAEVGLSVDRNKVKEGDTVYLTITYTGDSSKSPDLTSLQKDFNIVSNSSSSSYSYINGVGSKLKKWTIGIVPNKKGIIRIAPVEIDGIISNSQQIEVEEITNVVDFGKENNSDKYFKIETKIDVEEPYIQQQLTLWVNIFDSIGVNDGSIIIADEDKDAWIIKPLMEKPAVTQHLTDGKYFNVISLSYALYPLKSGKLKLPQFVFDGYFVKNNGFKVPTFEEEFFNFNVTFNDVFGTKVPVKAKTKEEYINVKPVLSGKLKKDWIAVKDLKLKSELSDFTKIRTGDAFSRKIEIIATGMPKVLFPELKFDDIDGLKQYPDKPEYVEEIIDNNVVTKAIFNTTYIPTKSGEINIPKVDISWLNTEKNDMQTSYSNSHNINIYPNDSLKKQQEQQVAQKATETVEQTIDKPEKEENNSTLLNKYLSKEIFVVLGGFLLVLLFIFILFRKNNSPKNKVNYKAQVVKAIEKHDLGLAKLCILNWAKDKFNNNRIQNFRDISDVVCSEEFSEQLNKLNKAIYSSEDILFESKKFIEIFLKTDKMEIRKDKKTEILPNLYD